MTWLDVSCGKRRRKVPPPPTSIQFLCRGVRQFPSEVTLCTVVCLCGNPPRLEPNWLQCILSVQKSHWVTLKMKQRVIAVPPRLAVLSRKTSTFNNFPGRYGSRLRGPQLRCDARYSADLINDTSLGCRLYWSGKNQLASAALDNGSTHPSAVPLGKQILSGGSEESSQIKWGHIAAGWRDHEGVRVVNAGRWPWVFLQAGFCLRSGPTSYPPLPRKHSL